MKRLLLAAALAAATLPAVATTGDFVAKTDAWSFSVFEDLMSWIGGDAELPPPKYDPPPKEEPEEEREEE